MRIRKRMINSSQYTLPDSWALQKTSAWLHLPPVRKSILHAYATLHGRFARIWQAETQCRFDHPSINHAVAKRSTMVISTKLWGPDSLFLSQFQTLWPIFAYYSDAAVHSGHSHRWNVSGNAAPEGGHCVEKTTSLSWGRGGIKDALCCEFP